MKELSIPINRAIFSPNGSPIHVIIEQECKINADAFLNPDAYSVVYTNLPSDTPYRVFLLPTPDEAKNLETMTVAKLGVISIYWREVANAIRNPYMLWEHSIIETSVVPAFIEGDYVHLLLKSNSDKKNIQRSHKARYPSYVYTMNWAGDNDFFAECEQRIITATTYHSQIPHEQCIPTSRFEIPDTLLHTILQQRKKFFDQIDILYINTVNQTVQESFSNQNLDNALIRYLRSLNYTQIHITAGWDIAKFVINQGMYPKLHGELKETISMMSRRFKKRLMIDGNDGNVWKAADALATSMDELYWIAKSHID